MSFSKLRRAASVAFAITFALGTVALIASATTQAQEQQQPAPEGEQAAPPPADGGGAAAPAQEGAQPSAEQPAPDTGAAPEAAPSGGNSAEVPPVQSETPAATAEPAAPAAPAEGAPAGAITASQVQIGAAVFGADGAKIGEVNGVKSDDSGKIQEILVTDGMPAGINAKVFEVPGDKITSVGDGVKLSLSSEEAKKLPIIDNSKG
ncbi:PRC-barrel domain-containing protein [Hyphomicrobium sp.]|uniref:PRC-barrel domain-containing protein n=1 Tax=Hyphomicrobium sp. TaxID=82 RepID=UPI000FA31AFC|nr:PRC-barrel domain-containing protein [Hyphomicrobium sp.]RUO98993.1 MAG: PRC-barrel domain containing protein [Hyphomicrobium sp.]